jgi:hypothetical protein
MSSDPTATEPTAGLERRALLLGGSAALATGVAGLTPARANAAATSPASRSAATGQPPASSRSATQPVPVPPVVRSRRALAAPAAPLPIVHGGVTYEIAQETVWLDQQHFAVGRWDGSMSVFNFETAAYQGPIITSVVSDPASQGVQMITKLPGGVIATSNDSGSLALWHSPSRAWNDLSLLETVSYDASLGYATNGAWLPVGHPTTLAVGHDSGYLTLWSYNPASCRLQLTATIALQNPNPVNPFGSHVIYGMDTFIRTGGAASVVVGSDDGYVSLVRVPSGQIMSQTVFNPAAQRGINSVSALGNKLLVSNCSVGADDYNTWYFSVDPATWVLTLLDKANLITDTSLVQAFNFDTVWGAYSGGTCWFASTEEGLLWMGTVTGDKLSILGSESLADGSFGAALAYATNPGRLVATIGNLYQYQTGAQ